MIIRLLWVFLAFFMTISFGCVAKSDFEQFFSSKTLRIDYMLAGNSGVTKAYVVRLKEEPIWGGSTQNMIDTLGLGMFKIEMIEKKSGTLIFSKGFCTLFEEWQTTEESKTMNRSFQQSNCLPFPKVRVDVMVSKRSKLNQWIEILKVEIDPESVDINKDKVAQLEVRDIIKSGNPNNCVDLVFLAEGYTADEMEQFYADAALFTNKLFEVEPFKINQSKFNVKAIGTISNESGTDDPNKKIWKNTCFNSSFNTFHTDRYLETFDVFNIYNAASLVAYDQIVVLVNTSKYGGGGVYNHFSVVAAKNSSSKTVFVHEFGHAFGGLGDEYYTSEVAYSDYIDLKTEPWEPNLTTLVNFELKWKDMVDKSTPVPTPDQQKYESVVGAFEGGGYTAKGVYRPKLDCRMKSNASPAFCPVCSRAIQRVIKQLTH